MLEKSTGTMRPFAGATVGKKTLDAWDETGDVQAAMSHIATDETYRYATIGFNLDTGLINATVSKDFGDSEVMRMGIGIDRAINERVSISANANRLLDGDNTSTYMSAGFKIRF
jgi:outer membrane autotransporter protein